MRHIETFFAEKKSTKFNLMHKNKNFNKSVSYVRRRVGRVKDIYEVLGIGIIPLSGVNMNSAPDFYIYKVYIRMWTFIIIRKV